MSVEIHKERKNIRDQAKIDIIVGLVCAVFLGIFSLFGRSFEEIKVTILDINSWLLLLTGFFMPAYFSAKYQALQDAPITIITRLIQRIHSKHRELSIFCTNKVLSQLTAIETELLDLQGSTGVRWTVIERLNAAISLFNSRDRINKYWATCTDPPYTSSEEDKRFIEAQEEKLRNADVRRLLVVPLNDLLTNLDTATGREHLKDFLRLHSPKGFKLQYWPYDTGRLSNHIRDGLPTAEARDALIDFGIIDNEIVFGQKKLDVDTDRPTGNGRIIVDSMLVAHYTKTFSILWDKMKKESYPEQQLQAWCWATENREDNKSETQDQTNPNEYFNFVIGKISTSQKLYAVDVARDINSWVNQDEYILFRDATISAAKRNKQGCYSRIYVLHNPFDNTQAAELFINQVALPQLKEGIHLYFLSSTALIDNDLAAIDFICDSNDWGFYLLPTDNFTKNSVSKVNNSVHRHHMQQFMSIFNNLHQCRTLKSAHDSANSLNLNSELKQFLCTLK